MEKRNSAGGTFLGFAFRVTLVHIVTYWVAGGLWYALVTHRYYAGPEALPGLRDPNSTYVMQWILPAQFLRGILYAIAFYPLRTALLGMGRWGGAVIASLLLLVGAVAGISGIIEAAVFSTFAHVNVFVATLPELVAQTLAFGYLVLWWERRRGETTARPSSRTA